MAKINKLFAYWDQFEITRKIYLTTHSNDRLRRLKRDEIGFYFIQYKKVERIEQPEEIERINKFLNIK